MLRGLWLFFVFLASPWQLSQTQTPPCQYTYSQTNQVLLDHVIASVPVIGLDKCFFACKGNSDCRSWNYQFDAGVCQLNNVTHCSKPSNFKTRVNSAYMVNPDFAHEC